MLTVQAIRRAAAAFNRNQAVQPYVFHVHPSLVRDLWSMAAGIAPRKHSKAGAARGRKRALLNSWRPINGFPASARPVEGLAWRL